MQVEGNETGLPPDGDRLTVAEMRDSIENLSDGDMARLVSAARGFSRLCGIAHEDLLQEAFARALGGSRTCERGESAVGFLCGVMKSFVSQENEARKRGFREKVIIRDGELVLPEVTADVLSPEQSAISAIDDRETLAKIEAMAAGDEQLQLLIEGIYDNMRGVELQELLSTDEKGLAAVRKKLRRLLHGAGLVEVIS
jgi:DNA-directed RNA polymerase specialized sigma24 family protein